MLYGKGAVSLATSQEVAKAGELARWIVMDSKLHPATRDDPVSLDLFPGGAPDPTVKVKIWGHRMWGRGGVMAGIALACSACLSHGSGHLHVPFPAPPACLCSAAPLL